MRSRTPTTCRTYTRTTPSPTTSWPNWADGRRRRAHRPPHPARRPRHAGRPRGGARGGPVVSHRIYVRLRWSAGTVTRDGDTVRVLGVDPGLTRCGLGVVDGMPGRPPALVGAGVLRTPAAADIAARLMGLEENIDRWLAEYRPDSVAVERVFSQHNVRTVMGTAQAGAVAILCAARRGLPVGRYTPSEVKAAVTGSGRADKAQVTAMVMRLLRMDAPPRPPDTADALALAICYLWRGGTRDRLSAAVAAAAARPLAPAGRPGRPTAP